MRLRLEIEFSRLRKVVVVDCIRLQIIIVLLLLIVDGEIFEVTLRIKVYELMLLIWLEKEGGCICVVHIFYLDEV